MATAQGVRVGFVNGSAGTADGRGGLGRPAVRTLALGSKRAVAKVPVIETRTALFLLFAEPGMAAVEAFQPSFDPPEGSEFDRSCVK